MRDPLSSSSSTSSSAETPRSPEALIAKWRRCGADAFAGIEEAEAKQMLITATALNRESATYRECADELEAVLRSPGAGLRAPIGWQPIATVPDEIKDEQTPILCWTPHTMAVAVFDNDEWWLPGADLVIEATHWMPLPDPPSGLSAGSGRPQQTTDEEEAARVAPFNPRDAAAGSTAERHTGNAPDAKRTER